MDLSGAVGDEQVGGGSGNGSGCAATGKPSPSSSKTNSVDVSNLKKQLCDLKDEKLIKEFDNFWLCEQCEEFFERKDGLWRHFLSHVFKFNCTQCKKPGSQQLDTTEMKNHIQKHHPWIKQVSDSCVREKPLNEHLAWKDPKDFLTVEQFRNSSPEKYEQLKNNPGKSLAGNRAEPEVIVIDDEDEFDGSDSAIVEGVHELLLERDQDQDHGLPNPVDSVRLFGNGNDQDENQTVSEEKETLAPQHHEDVAATTLKPGKSLAGSRAEPEVIVIDDDDEFDDVVEVDEGSDMI